MARRLTSKRHTTLKATGWFLLVMLPSWWALLHGCSFEPSSLKRHAQAPVVIEHDEDGGE